MTTRESFAIEQLEITKGPNSSFAGRGTAGGAINAITKQATLDYDFARASRRLRHRRQYRAHRRREPGASPSSFALRANVLYGYERRSRPRARRPRAQGRRAVGPLRSRARPLDHLDYYDLRGPGQPRPRQLPRGRRARPHAAPIDVPVYAQEQDFLALRRRHLHGAHQVAQFAPERRAHQPDALRHRGQRLRRHRRAQRQHAYLAPGQRAPTSPARSARTTAGRTWTTSPTRPTCAFDQQALRPQERAHPQRRVHRPPGGEGQLRDRQHRRLQLPHHRPPPRPTTPSARSMRIGRRWQRPQQPDGPPASTAAAWNGDWHVKTSPASADGHRST